MKEKKFEAIIYSSLSDSLRVEWKHLWEQSPTANIENSPGWFDAACDAFCYEKKVILALYNRQSDELVALVPLAEVRLYGLRVFTMPGLDFTTHTAILGDLSEDALKKRIVMEMKKLGTVYLTGLTQEQARVFSRFGNGISLFPSDREYVMDVTKWPLGEFPKRKWHVVLNRARRSPEHITARLVEKNHAEALQTCFHIDRASAKHRQGKGVFWRNDARLFYMLLAKNYPSCISITLLYVGDTPAAYDMKFVCKGIYVGSQKAYLPEYTYYNPGFFTFIKSVESVPPDNRMEISFGKGQDHFKSYFTKNIRVLHSAIISEQYFNRLFLTFMLSTREKIYHAFVAHPRLYAGYKRLKDGTLV
jgi:CelD/BcsL family acetyltransferase involved in cellulose biosynthesis